MNAPLAHSPFGGSVAARILRCPASVRLVEKVPLYLRKSSSYAARGSALHAAMALLIENERSIAEVFGENVDGYVITLDDVENALRPVLAYVETLLDQPGAEYYLEKRVTFPDIDNTYGTADLLVRIGNTLHVIDFKFGSGVKVLALYPDGNEDVLNAQNMFYAAGTRHSLSEFAADVSTFVLTILQPQSIEPDAEMVSSVSVTNAEIDEFIAAYIIACAEALSPSPRLERGAHCRFCPAKPICPAHTAPLLDLAQFEMPAPAAPPSKEAYLQLLAAGLDLVDAVRDIGVALRDQAKRALESGDLVPGHALSAGRAARHWRDESAAIAALTALGFSRDDIVAEAMRSPHQVELRAKARGLKISPELIVSARSGVSLVRAENARVPIPHRGELVRSFTEALDALQEVGSHE